MWKTKSAQSARLIREALDLLDQGLFVFDGADRLRYANRAVETLAGIPPEEIVDRPSGEIVDRLRGLAEDPDDLAPLAAHLEDPKEIVSLEFGLDGECRLALEARAMTEAGRPIGRLWLLRDLTVLERARQEAHDLRKLEGLGMLAGGIAHDFNNLLSTILGHTELGLEDADSDSEVADSLRSIARVAERASQLTQQMLAYAGKGTVVVEPIDLSQAVRDVLELLPVTLGPAIELELALAEDLPPIIVDAVQIRQVVMNLVLNAAEALDEGGSIEIATGMHHLDEQQLAAGSGDPGTEPGEFVYVEVTDSGHGIDEATLERIFDPFFSTKFTGRGLGLAAVHGIVRGHRGLVRIASRPGQGTVFTVDLPRGYAADPATAPTPT